MIKLCQLKKDTSPERVNLERKLLNYIMKMISDQTGFLIEDKVHELLKIHTQKAQVVIKLDHVFQVI